MEEGRDELATVRNNPSNGGADRLSSGSRLTLDASIHLIAHGRPEIVPIGAELAAVLERVRARHDGLCFERRLLVSGTATHLGIDHTGEVRLHG